MKLYTVQVAPDAADKIAEYTRFIAEQSGSNEIAQKWSDRVYFRVSTLSRSPRRFTLAEEDAHCDYEIFRLIIGNHLALYNVDEATRTVSVVGFRHGSQLPRPDELPEDPLG